jgi:hypothetical protein
VVVLVGSLMRDAAKRPSYPELLRHPFLTRSQEVFVDMAAWASDAYTRRQIAKGTMVDPNFTPSPLAANGYIDPDRAPVLPVLSASASMFLVATPSAEAATSNPTRPDASRFCRRTPT